MMTFPSIASHVTGHVISDNKVFPESCKEM